MKSGWQRGFYSYYFMKSGWHRGVFGGCSKVLSRNGKDVVEFLKNARRARARTSRSVIGGPYQKKHKKLPKNQKNAFFRTKKHLLKLSSATWTGVFCPPPVECLRSQKPPLFDFVSGHTGCPKKEWRTGAVEDWRS